MCQAGESLSSYLFGLCCFAEIFDQMFQTHVFCMDTHYAVSRKDPYQRAESAFLQFEQSCGTSSSQCHVLRTVLLLFEATHVVLKESMIVPVPKAIPYFHTYLIGHNNSHIGFQPTTKYPSRRLYYVHATYS